MFWTLVHGFCGACVQGRRQAAPTLIPLGESPWLGMPGKPGAAGQAGIRNQDEQRPVRHAEIDSSARDIGEIASVADIARVVHDSGAQEKFGIRIEPAVERKPVSSAGQVIGQCLPVSAVKVKPASFGFRTPVERSVEIRIDAQAVHAGNVKSNICMKQVKYSTALPLSRSKS